MKTNDHRITQSLKKLTGVDARGDIGAYMEMLDMVPDCPLDLPFNFKRLVIVYETIPLLHQIMFPKPSHLLLDILGDLPGEPFLITDAGSSGVDSLYIVTQTDCESNTARTWMAHAQHVKAVINEHPKYGTLFAIALTSFYNA